MWSRREFIQTTAALTAAAIAKPARAGTRPVILDTDIGDDIDDTWALLMLLRMPELDLKLVVSDYGNAIYRCRLLAKLLERTGRTDVPIGIGEGREDKAGQQSGWIGDYQLKDYRGVVHEDGVQAIIDTIKASPEPVTLFCIGPVPNIAEALRRDPRIVDNARFVGMHGSIYKGYAGESDISAEWNVQCDPQALQKVFAAPWDCTITPLDTCGLVVLDGPNYRQLHDSDDPWMMSLMENYRAWLSDAPYIDKDIDTSKVSTTLFDTVAVYLAAEDNLLEMGELPLRVTDDGYTIIDEANGRPVNCAISWKDLEEFKRRLTTTLLG
jgi:inosine-uridine nucleoside N-ribohydrolase